jgi:hypothetical protein
VSLVAASVGLARSNTFRRSAGAVGGVAALAALSVATLSRPDLARAIGEGVGDGIHGVQTVAAMLADRSPGERPDGALASLKPKRQAAVHQRALPKVRGPAPPPSPYQALVSTPPSPVVALPPETPLYNVVAGGPAVITPAATGGGGGTPPGLSQVPLPGGGGGGFISPPGPAATPDIPATPVTPLTPVTPVPEPATWAMMLVGFAFIGRALRRKSGATLQPATD